MQKPATESQHNYLRMFQYTIVILVMANLSAGVDAVFHPEIEYFDDEHLIMGFFTGLLTWVMLLIFHIYTRKLEKALKKISKLENILPICTSCKKIRIGDKNAKTMDAWQSIDVYISDKTTTQFSHGMCPECMEKMYGHANGDTLKSSEAGFIK